MKKTIFLIIILIAILFSFTGCTYTNGIDSYYFITALAIDKGDNGLLKITVQISSTSSENSSGGGGSAQSSSYKLYSAEAATIDEGITILNNYLNKKINLSHCSALILSEDIAKNGIKTYFNTLSNNTELRHSCKLIVSSTTGYDILDKVSNSGEVFSSRLFDYLTTSADYTGFTITSTFGTFFQSIHNSSFEPTTIYTTVNDDVIQTDGIAVFKGEYMVGHIDALGSISHLMVTNELNTCVITVDNPFDENEKIDLEIGLYKNTKIDTQIINGTTYITIDIFPEGTIRSSGSTFNYIDNGNVKTVEDSTNKYLKSVLKNYLYEISRKYDSDIVGFEAIYKAKFLTEKESENAHWKDVFKDSFFEVNINTKINSSNLFNKE